MKTKQTKSERFFAEHPELNKFKTGNSVMLDRLFTISRVSIANGKLECWSESYNGYIRVEDENTVVRWIYDLNTKSLKKIDKEVYKL